MENFKDWFRYPFQDTIHTSQSPIQIYIRKLEQQKEEIEYLKEQLSEFSEQIDGLKRRIQALENEKVYRSQLSVTANRQSNLPFQQAKSLQNAKRRKGGF